MCENLKNKTNEETRKHIHSYRYRGKKQVFARRDWGREKRKVGEGG